LEFDEALEKRGTSLIRPSPLLFRQPGLFRPVDRVATELVVTQDALLFRDGGADPNPGHRAFIGPMPSCATRLRTQPIIVPEFRSSPRKIDFDPPVIELTQVGSRRQVKNYRDGKSPHRNLSQGWIVPNGLGGKLTDKMV